MKTLKTNKRLQLVLAIYLVITGLLLSSGFVFGIDQVVFQVGVLLFVFIPCTLIFIGLAWLIEWIFDDE